MNKIILTAFAAILFSFAIPSAFADAPFITTWTISNSDKELTFNVGTGNDINIDWGDGITETVSSGDVSHTYTDIGTFTIEISGDDFTSFEPLYGDTLELITVEQWGDTQWSTTNHMFFNTNNLNVVASDTPNLTQVTDMSSMFYSADHVNFNINDWDVSNVSDMEVMFADTLDFNSNMNDWDVSSVTTMKQMFFLAKSFDVQNICDWDLTNIVTTEIHKNIDDCIPVELFCGEPESFYVNVIYGTEGVDLLLGTDKRDIMYGYGGNDFIYGGAGIDCIYGGDGDDFIQGGKGRDVIYGGEGDDHIRTGKHNDTVYGEGGNDILLATHSLGFNTLDGGDGEDICATVNSAVTFTTINCEITN